MWSRAKGVARAWGQGGPQHRRSGNFKNLHRILPQGKGAQQGNPAGPHGEQGHLQSPGVTNIGGPRGESAHTPRAELSKGLEPAPGEGGASGRSRWVRGGSGKRRLRPAALGAPRSAIPGSWGTRPRILRPPGTGRGGEGTGQRGAPAPRLCGSAPPTPGAPRPVWTGSCGGYCRSRLQGWGPGHRQWWCSSWCHPVPGRGGAPGKGGLLGSTAPMEPSTGGRGSSPRCTHLRVSTAASPPETSWGDRGRAGSWLSSAGKLQGKWRDLQHIEPEGTPPIFFLLFPVQLVFISDCKFPIFFLLSHLNYNALPPLHF